MSLAVKTSSGHAVRATAPRKARRAARLSDETVQAIAGMSPDELVLWNDTEGLPTALAVRVARARKAAAQREREMMPRLRRKDYEPAVWAAKHFLKALDAGDDVGPVLAELRKRMKEVEAA